MENKKLGATLIVIAVIMGIFLFNHNSQLTAQATEIGCYPMEEDCAPIEKSISLNNLGIGIFAFILALGFYLLFFNKTEQAILKKLEDEKNQKVNDEKLKYILMALDPYEQKVIKAVKSQDGITQNTLKLRTNMSKAKLSYVLQELEKRNLIKRERKGKTMEIFLKI